MLISFEIKGLMKQSYENEASKYVGHLAVNALFWYRPARWLRLSALI